MDIGRRSVVAGLVALPLGMGAARAEASRETVAVAALDRWYALILELVRHTPTYSPPVASRSFAYLGITAYEVVAAGLPGWRSLAGQVSGLAPLPGAEPGCDVAVALQAALAQAVAVFFGNTGPTGQRAMAAMEKAQTAKVAEGLDPAVVAASAAYGRAVAAHLEAWSQGDGGAVIHNMGFPASYREATEPWQWVPTSRVAQQQTPLLPDWGKNRLFRVPEGGCGLTPPPAYSEEPGSEFYRQAVEVRDAIVNLTPEQARIARFWSDDPMLSPTPPGHWISIAQQIFERDAVGLADRVDVLARLGIALSDAFVVCWAAKYQYDLLRPVTYIRKVMDPKWEPLLNTPPFPEYPSGHSTQSGAAAGVLTAIWGADFAFVDRTHEDDGLDGREFASFAAAAEEAGISRLYGGIHFRAAIDLGLDQGACVAEHVNTLVTKG